MLSTLKNMKRGFLKPEDQLLCSWDARGDCFSAEQHQPNTKLLLSVQGKKWHLTIFFVWPNTKTKATLTELGPREMLLRIHYNQHGFPWCSLVSKVNIYRYTDNSKPS